jgi:tetratricopeptide (TPR) repeat protein
VAPVESALAPAFWGPLAALAVYAWLVAWTARRDRTVAFGLAWIAIALLPVCGLAGWPRPTPLAERYLLLPSVGWAIVVAGLAARAATSSRRLVRDGALALAAGLGVAFAAGTAAMLPVWRDDLVLLQRITRDAPAWTTGRAALARAYARADRWDDAVAEFRAAAELEPGNPSRTIELARALEHAGRLDEADQVLRDARRSGDLVPIVPPR